MTFEQSLCTAIVLLRDMKKQNFADSTVFVPRDETFIATQSQVIHTNFQDHVLESCVSQWTLGNCSWEQALATAVVLMIEDLSEIPYRRKPMTVPLEASCQAPSSSADPC